MAKINLKSVWVRVLMALSGTALAVLLMQTESWISFAVTGGLALALMVFLLWRTPLLEKISAPRRTIVWILAGATAISEVYTAKSTFFSCCVGWMYKLIGAMGLPNGPVLVRIVPWIVACAALPMAFGYLLWFFDTMYEFAIRFWRESDFTERMFFLGAGILLSMMVVFAYQCTQAFYGAHINGGWYNFDLVYSADSGYLKNQDVFRNVGAEQNDLRQPLFGLFCLPFAQLAYLVSRVLFFVPESYITVLQIFSVLIFLTAVVLIGRMMGLRGAEKAMLLCLLSVSYPVLIFSLTVEQYLLAVFYLILYIYLEHEPVGQKLGFVAATGSLLTTGILFPLCTWDRKFSVFVRRTLKLLLVFLAVLILSGRLTTFLDIPSYIAGYGHYTGVDVSMTDKLMQYVSFVRSCLIAPPSRMDVETYNHFSWQMIHVTWWSLKGLAVFAAALVGVVLGWKRRFTKICGFWMAFSLVLLGLVGWGTIDNGLMLYTLYFGWAFVAMLFQAVDRIFDRIRPLKLMLLMALVVGVGIYNVCALKEVLVFSTQFFPALGG